jgi:hypothetical protein
LVTYYTVFVIDLASRRVHILGSTPYPGDVFMGQIVRLATAAPNANARRAIRLVDQGRVSRSNHSAGKRHFRRTIAEFVEHYHRERNHQRLDNRLITGRPRPTWPARVSALAPGRITELLRACGVIRESAEMWNTTPCSERAPPLRRAPYCDDMCNTYAPT